MKLYLLTGTVVLFIISCNSSTNEKPVPDVRKDTTAIITTDSAGKTATSTGKIDIESFGDIKLGQPATQLMRVLGKPENKTKAIEWEADGLLHEDWTWKSKGLIINLSSEIGDTTTLKVFSIRAKAPCTFKTKANIGIGSSYAEVQEAYSRDINAEESNKEQVTVGSIYGGIIFTFRNDKVESIFLGAAAE